MKRTLTAVVVTALLAMPATAESKLAAQAFPLPVPKYLAEIIGDASTKYKVDPNLIAAMAFRESRFDPSAVSRRGAQGVMQLMPRTAKSLGVKDSFDPRDNIFAATRYLRTLLDRFHGDVELSLAAYNAGPELVAKAGPKATAEAVDYVDAVKRFYLTALAAL
jgi:soluble lytic murein transglycosylase-like protein